MRKLIVGIILLLLVGCAPAKAPEPTPARVGCFKNVEICA
jgi:hypothetical protein